MSGVYRRYHKPKRANWGAWLLVGGVVLAVGGAIVAVVVLRGTKSAVVLGPAAAPPDADRWTERELVAYLSAKGVNLTYHGGGAISEYDGWEEAKTFGHIAFRCHKTPEDARMYVGATVRGFQWGSWTFVESGKQGGAPDLAAAVKKALGVK